MLGGGAGDSAAPATVEELRGSSNSGDMELEEKRVEEGGGDSSRGGGGGGGGNRWPRHETVELLRIRSEMDSIFRDSTPKAPLWEEVSRKLGELGYKRSAKKCKEKFENVYKYHKRTKDGRTAKHDGKSYRFFQELEAFDGQQLAVVVEKKNHHHQQLPPPLPALPWGTAVTSHQIMGTIPSGGGNNGTSTTPAANNTTMSINFTITPPHHQQQSHLSPTVVTPAEPISSSQPLNPSPQSVFHPSYNHHRGQHHNGHRSISATTHLFSSSTSSSTASDEKMEEKGTKSRKRKRKLRDFFHRLTKDVIKKQEELQKRFLETVEKLDRERLDREGAWRVQEMARINREHEILIQERSTAAAKDAAVLALLQKVSGGGVRGAQITPRKLSLPSPPPPILSQPALVSQNNPTHIMVQKQKPAPITTNVGGRIESNGEDVHTVATITTTTSSRWPKPEVLALIGLRTQLDEKYQENVPKGPLWEEISTEMKKLGYNRNAKRCKEKWENINKYFKKVKESSRKRPEDSKTCPYFHQLDALYREKSKVMEQPTNNPTISSGAAYIEANPIRAVEPATTIHHWFPPPPPPPPHPPTEEEDEDEEVDEDDYENEETDEEVETGVRGFEIVHNKPAMVVGGNGE